jgi:hypothetical protein
MILPMDGVGNGSLTGTGPHEAPADLTSAVLDTSVGVANALRRAFVYGALSADIHAANTDAFGTLTLGVMNVTDRDANESTLHDSRLGQATKKRKFLLLIRAKLPKQIGAERKKMNCDLGCFCPVN